MGDLIRNYKLILKRRSAEDSDSDTESQPLMSSTSSSNSRSFASSGPIMHFPRPDTDTEIEVSQENPQINVAVPAVLTEHRKCRYESLELGKYEDIFEKRFSNGSFRELLTGEKSLDPNGVSTRSYDYSDYLDIEGPNRHNSLVTIFAIWNTTVGTSLLSMSWGIEKTGLFPAILINMAIAAICLYTAYMLLQVNEKHGVIGQNGEVSDLCSVLIGRWAEILAKIFSLMVLIGANIVYWILMSNFFYNSVHFFYSVLLQLDDGNVVKNESVLCPKNDTIIVGTNVTYIVANQSNFDRFWNLYSTVPVILAVIMFPMLNWKSATFFTKFNSLGTLSVLYLIIFVGAKASSWGVNIPNWGAEFYIKPTFCALSGMLSLSYFIHNIIVSIMRNNNKQEHNGRDLTIAFSLITFTYLFIGVVFYVTFPLPKFCIEDNLLNNFNKNDTLTIIARILLLFQLFTVFPLISYMLRNDIFANINMIFKNYRFGDFTYGRVVSLNVGILTVCILFACFMPRIGTLIRYTGAFSGLVYIFLLPSLLKISSLQKEGNLTNTKMVFHVSVIVLGCLNLLSQFFISDE